MRSTDEAEDLVLRLSIASRSGLLFCDVTISLRPRRSLVGFTEISAPLRATPLTAAHRHGDDQHHQHHCDRDHDYDDSGRYGYR